MGNNLGPTFSVHRGIKKLALLKKTALLKLNRQITKEFIDFYLYNTINVREVLFIPLVFFILLINVLGLIPYAFSCSARFVFSINFGFPV